MSDFLTRLAQRSMGAAPLIAPRLPSLFAPGDESPIISVADTTSVTDAAQMETLAHPLQSQATGRIDSATDEVRASVFPTQYPTATEAASATRIAPDPAQVEATLLPLVKAAQANFQATAPLSANTPQVASSLQPATAARTPDKTAAAPEPLMPLLPQRRTESVVPFAAMSDNPSGADTTTPAPPTVHITIGRVEVRANIAAAPQAAPRPRPTSQPALSLSDYLKRGAGAS